MSKLKVNSQYAMLLNDIFLKLNLPGDSDLDIIATYLALQLHFGHITKEKINHLINLTLQVAEMIKEFDSKDQFQQV